MKKLRKFGAFVTACALAVAVAGCSSKPTAQSLAKDAGKNMEEIKSVRTVENIDFDATISMSGVSMDMAMDIGMDIKLINDPQVKGQMEITMALAAADESEEFSMETYLEQDDDKLVTYSTEDGGLSFSRSEEDLSDYDLNTMVDNTLYAAIEKGDVEATLREETENVNDTEVYVIETTLTGDQFKDVIENSFSELNDAEIISADTDWSEMSAPTVLYIAKDTKYPVKMTMECSSLGNAMIETLFGAQDLGDATVEVKNFDITAEFSDFNAVEDIEIPAAAKDAPEEEEEDVTGQLEDSLTDTIEDVEDAENITDDGNDSEDVEITEGSLTMTDGVMTASIEVPEGVDSLYQSDEKYISAYGNSGNAFFFFNDYQSMDTFLSSEENVDWMKEDTSNYKNVEASEVKKMTVGGMEVSYIVVDFQFNETKMRDIHAAVQAGDELLCVDITSYDSSYSIMWDESILETLFAAVTIE